MILEASVNDSTFVKVGDSLFYTNYSATLPIAPPKWADTVHGWVRHQSLLQALAHKSKVVFRFRFQSNNNVSSEGFAFDDFMIATPSSLVFRISAITLIL